MKTAVAGLTQPEQSQISTPTGETILYRAEPLIRDGNHGVFVVAHSTAGELKEVDEAVFVVTRVTIVVFLIASLLAWLAAGRMLAPLRLLAKVARSVNDPPILILDESTAGLDPASEAQLLDKLLWHRQGKTTILISHRPRVIMQADWIVFLQDGALKLQGILTDLRSIAGEHLDFLVA